jgi:LacI family transcriptional regulator
MQRKDPGQPTIENVAYEAGVSTATVSRVLNRPESVREGLRLRVREAVALLGYVPHAGARALKLQRSGTVGAIFPTIDNAIFAQAIDALQQRLADGGLQLLIATCGYDVDTVVPTHWPCAAPARARNCCSSWPSVNCRRCTP